MLIEEVVPSVFRVKVPLPNNPLKYTNSYIIKARDGCLIIDTGFNVDECYNTLALALNELRVEKPLFLSTHLHADHMGLVGRFSDSILMSSIEIECIEEVRRSSHDYWKKLVDFYVMNGFPKEEAGLLLRLHPGIRYTYWRDFKFKKLSDADVIALGDVSLRCILTPGHTPGHICLYDEERKVLFSGDHVLFDITPNISWMPMLEDPLNEYLKSLEKLLSLNVKLVLPGHRDFGINLRERIEELKAHHEKRLKEALSALDHPKTAWEVAPSISWDIEEKDLSKLPVIQKWFIVGETIAHLEHLVRKGEVGKVEVRGRILYYC
ncbi:MAG: MBL fold metallo-hydrolase [Candidatus Nezhaarchaeales archaeon]